MSSEAFPSAVMSSTPNNWFSPAVLFFLLNLTIAFIAISSKLNSSSKHEAGKQDHHNSHQRPGGGGGEEEDDDDHYNSGYSEPPMEPQEQERESAETGQGQEMEHGQETEDIDDRLSYDEIYGKIKMNDAWRREAPARMGRSWSMKSDFGQYYERGEGSGGGGGGDDGEVERRRPATAREWREGDEGVDARAADFINRFKQQLNLQRLESYSRHRARVGLGGRNK